MKSGREGRVFELEVLGPVDEGAATGRGVVSVCVCVCVIVLQVRREVFEEGVVSGRAEEAGEVNAAAFDDRKDVHLKLGVGLCVYVCEYVCGDRFECGVCVYVY